MMRNMTIKREKNRLRSIAAVIGISFLFSATVTPFANAKAYEANVERYHLRNRSGLIGSAQDSPVVKVFANSVLKTRGAIEHGEYLKQLSAVPYEERIPVYVIPHTEDTNSHIFKRWMSALHIGWGMEQVRHLNQEQSAHKIPSFRDIFGKTYYMHMHRTRMQNGYTTDATHGALNDYYEILIEKWKLSDEEISKDPRREPVMNLLKNLFFEELGRHPSLGIHDLIFTVHRGKKVIKLDEQGQITSAMLAPFIPLKKRFTHHELFRFANSSISDRALFSPDLDLLDALVDLMERQPNLALKILRAIPMREFRVQELYLEGKNYDEAHNDPSVLEIPGHEELVELLWQVARLKLERELSGKDDNETLNPLEEKISETRAYIKYWWSDETLENYKSLVEKLKDGKAPIGLIEAIYQLRNVPGLGDLINRLYWDVEKGSFDDRVLSRLYRAYELSQEGYKILSLGIDLMEIYVDIVAFDSTTKQFHLYGLNTKSNREGFTDDKVKKFNELISRLADDEPLANRVSFVLDALMLSHKQELFDALKDGKLAGNTIVLRDRAKVQLRTKMGISNIERFATLSKTAMSALPVIAVGIVASLLSTTIPASPGWALDTAQQLPIKEGASLLHNLDNLYQILTVSAVAGLAAYKLHHHLEKDSNGKLPSTQNKPIGNASATVKKIATKIMNILGEPIESLYQGLAIFSAKKSNIRILLNEDDPKSISEVNRLIQMTKGTSIGSEEAGIERRLNLMVVGNFKNKTDDEVLDILTSKGINLNYVRKILNYQMNEGKYDLQEILDDLKSDSELSKEDYSLWVLNSRNWDISRIVKSIAERLMLKSGLDIIELNLKGSIAARVSA